MIIIFQNTNIKYQFQNALQLLDNSIIILMIEGTSAGGKGTGTGKMGIVIGNWIGSGIDTEKGNEVIKWKLP